MGNLSSSACSLKSWESHQGRVRFASVHHWGPSAWCLAWPPEVISKDPFDIDELLSHGVTRHCNSLALSLRGQVTSLLLLCASISSNVKKKEEEEEEREEEWRKSRRKGGEGGGKPHQRLRVAVRAEALSILPHSQHSVMANLQVLLVSLLQKWDFTSQAEHLSKGPQVKSGQGGPWVPISVLQGPPRLLLDLKILNKHLLTGKHACTQTQSQKRRCWYKPGSGAPMTATLRETAWEGSSGARRQGILTYPGICWTESLLQAAPPPLPQECYPEGETWGFWKGAVNSCPCALLCKCYTNWSIKSGPNDAILLCLPACLCPSWDAGYRC